jgi:hypothetical protein
LGLVPQLLGVIVRTLYPRDLDELKRIHEKFYKDEFSFPNFYDKFLCVAAVIDNDEIISAGGIRTIAESVVITNKDASVRKRQEALKQILGFSMYAADHSGYDQFHAFIQDEQWERHLLNAGFKHTKGKALVYG